MEEPIYIPAAIMEVVAGQPPELIGELYFAELPRIGESVGIINPSDGSVARYRVMDVLHLEERSFVYSPYKKAKPQLTVQRTFEES